MNVRFAGAKRHKLHQLLFRSISCRHFTGETPLLHRDDAIAQRNDFRKFRRDYDDGSTALSELPQKVMDLGFSADIDSPSGLIHEENSWFQRQIPGQHHLLLVSARQSSDDHVFIGHTDPKVLLKLADQSSFGVSINEISKSAQPLKARKRQVASDTLGKEKRVLLTVFRNQRHSQIDGGSRRVDLYRFLFQVDSPGFE